MVAVGEAPAVALNRVDAALADSRYPLERTKSRITVGGPPPLNDYLLVEATAMDVGTRVELRGHIDPEPTDAVLRALARSRPWTWAPSWD